MKNLLITTIICGFLLCPLGANAGTASDVADKTINYTAKGTYYITKYTLKAAWFITKKTAKGLKVLTVATFKATRDAFGSKPKSQPVKTPPAEDYYLDNTLPPPPILD